MDDNLILNNQDIDMLNSIDLENEPKLNDDEMLDSNGESLNEEENEDDQEEEDGEEDENDDSFILDTETKTPGEILDEFCVKLKDVQSTLPETVVSHYMKKTGFIVSDPKIVKVISIASQKFISEIVNDVMQHHKLKSKTTTTTNVNPSSSNTNTAQASTSNQAQASASSTNQKNQSCSVLTLEDLSHVLTEYGINVKKPYYFM
ncbi:unnamed protein product [Brachionus calyciflorus]|uniref:Transcription initiation factor TFIID subunit 10 n=1 Tax=Brachionus calyciflorus TaxID=104777 RepID=A0A813U283_9BILA|nr:unnamed protein product [Brachionus calyciflorus]